MMSDVARSAEVFRATAWAGKPSLLPLGPTGPSNRFAWVPFVGVGRLVVGDGVAQFEPNRFANSLWRGGEVAPVELHRSYISVREIGPSNLGGNAVYSPFLGSLLARLVFVREPDFVELQIGV